MKKDNKTSKAQCTIQNDIGSALEPKKVNHGDVWGHGSNWYTFHCPKCNTTLQGEKNNKK